MRVIELSSRVPGSHLGRILFEQGSETILMEPPDGHSPRKHGPFAESKDGAERSLEFAHYHLNKKGVTLNLDLSEGRELFDELVQTADILMTDYSPDHPLPKNLLDYDRLSEIAPELILTSITPYGLEGPNHDYAAADITIQAMGGFAQINGDPERLPLQLPSNQAGHMGALNAMTGTLGAVFYREFNGGTGQLVDVSQQEAILIHLEYHLQLETFDSYEQNPMFPDHHVGRRSSRFFSGGNNVPVGIFPCKDGMVCMGGAQSHEIKAIAEYLGGSVADLYGKEINDPMSIEDNKRIQKIVDEYEKPNETT